MASFGAWLRRPATHPVELWAGKKVSLPAQSIGGVVGGVVSTVAYANVASVTGRLTVSGNPLPLHGTSIRLSRHTKTAKVLSVVGNAPQESQPAAGTKGSSLGIYITRPAVGPAVRISRHTKCAMIWNSAFVGPQNYSDTITETLTLSDALTATAEPETWTPPTAPGGTWAPVTPPTGSWTPSTPPTGPWS
jgi:hypothetical protein